jgi:integrase/recombinase XerD
MKKGFDIHNYQKRYEQGLAKLERSDILIENKKSIVTFVQYNDMQGMSIARRERYIGVLAYWAKCFAKPFREVTKEDVICAVGKLQLSRLRPWTKSTYKSMLKRFFKWLISEDEEYPNSVKWISSKLAQSDIEKTKNEDLLTEGDILQMIRFATHPRDKALISVLYESGCRIGEIGSLQIKNLLIDQHGARLEVNGKTGERIVRVISSVPYLTQWLDIHPMRDNSSCALWTNIGNVNQCKIMKHAAIHRMLNQTAQRAGISKKVNPHKFRHARASFLADHLTEFQMNQHFGWTQGSNMPSVYVHMSNRKIDEKLLSMQGIQLDFEKEVEMKPQICPRCACINSQEARFCMKCSSALNLVIALEEQAKIEAEKAQREQMDDRMRIMLQNTEFRELFMKLVEKG